MKEFTEKWPGGTPAVSCVRLFKMRLQFNSQETHRSLTANEDGILFKDFDLFLSTNLSYFAINSLRILL